MTETNPAPTIASPPPGLWARACFGESSPLKELAQRYWPAAYAWLRACGIPASDAPGHVSGFFTRLHAGMPPPRDEPSAARFREYMEGQLKIFLTQGCPPAETRSILEVTADREEAGFTSARYKNDEDAYSRRFALRLLESSLEALQKEYLGNGKTALYNAMKPFLGFHAADGGYAEAGKAVNLSASAFHLQVFSFRKRYRAILRAQITDITRYADDVDSELTVLLVAAS